MVVVPALLSRFPGFSGGIMKRKQAVMIRQQLSGRKKERGLEHTGQTSHGYSTGVVDPQY